MREKLNGNPAAQIALIGVLALVAGYFVLSSMGGGGEAESEGGVTTTSATIDIEVSAEGAVAGSAPSSSGDVAVPTDRSLPDDVERAYADGRTIVLLVVRAGSIDDRLVRDAAEILRGDPDVALFVVDAKEIARYAAISGPLGVESSPALIVVRPRGKNDGGPASATVSYGFQRAEDIRQAVRDAAYDGPSLGYAPR